MKQVYTGRDEIEAYFVMSLLDAEGIEAVVHGAVLGMARGSLPMTEGTLPSVWVRDGDVPRAVAVVDEYRQSRGRPSPRSSWRCPGCGEMLEGQFMACWKCGTGRDQPAEPVAAIPLGSNTLDYASADLGDAPEDLPGDEPLSWPPIETPDLEQVIEFYTQRMGFEAMAFGDEQVVVERDGLRLMFLAGGDGPARVELDVMVNDVLHLFREFQEHGVPVHDAHVEDARHGRFSVTDPAGATLRFIGESAE